MCLALWAAKFDPFVSLDCTRVEGVGAQFKERKGSNFAAQRSGAIVQKPEGPNTYDLKIRLKPSGNHDSLWSKVPRKKLHERFTSRRHTPASLVMATSQPARGTSGSNWLEFQLNSDNQDSNFLSIEFC